MSHSLNVNRILCPVDFSKHSQAANIYASLFAQSSDAELVYLFVDWPPTNDEPFATRADDLQVRLQDKVRPLVRDLNVRYEVREGEPGTEIVRFANANDIDLIVVGTHGRTGAMRLLHGSVCEKVLQKADCPVMAVKPSQESLASPKHATGNKPDTDI